MRYSDKDTVRYILLYSKSEGFKNSVHIYCIYIAYCIQLHIYAIGAFLQPLTCSAEGPWPSWAWCYHVASLTPSLRCLLSFSRRCFHGALAEPQTQAQGDPLRGLPAAGATLRATSIAEVEKITHLFQLHRAEWAEKVQTLQHQGEH